MAPPKGKGSKQKTGALADHGQTPHHSDLLRLIEANGDLPLDIKLQLLHCAQQAPCPPDCKGGRKDRPACLCGLIPDEGHFRKAGLFSKTPAVLEGLGPDPRTQRREVRAWVLRIGDQSHAKKRFARRARCARRCCIERARSGAPCARAPLCTTHASNFAASPPPTNENTNSRPTAPSACATSATRAT